MLERSPKVIRTVRTNAQPILMPRSDATPNTKGIELSEGELMDRVHAIKSNDDFQTRVGLAISKRYEDREPSPHPELQIYDRFPDRSDENLMAAFHDSGNWQERETIARKFEDQRLKHFAFRAIYAEAPDVLRPEHRNKIEGWIADRIRGSEGDTIWTTLPSAIDEAKQIQVSVNGNAGEHMAGVAAYLHELERRWL